jgi:5'-AMP-activated protein kinase regulatory gamma subunit
VVAATAGAGHRNGALVHSSSLRNHAAHGPPQYVRSYSVRETTTTASIGPTEFVEMYRSRAYSDPRLMDRNRLLAERRRKLLMSPSLSPPLSPAAGLSSSIPTVGAFEPRQMIIWKDHTSGTHIFRLPSTDEEEIIDVGNFGEQSDDLVFLRFLKCHSCYDVLPTSNKLVVLDTQLNVKKAFFALVDNGIRAAPLWDTDAQTIVGLFTVTDFIRILLKYNSASQFAMEDIEHQTIATWTELLSDVHVRPLVSISPDATMLEAIRQLCLHHVHRLPVVDPKSGNMLSSLTHKSLLKYLYYFFQHYGLQSPTFMEQTVEELGIGTFIHIATICADTPLLTTLNLFLSRRVSALPVVDGNGRLIGVYSKADIMNLAAEKTYANLTDTVERVMTGKNAPGTLATCPATLTCQRSESLSVIVDRIVQNGLHRLFAVDAVGRVEGVVSLSDILRRLVLTPEESQDSVADSSSSLFADRLIDFGDD